jgi:hypothetical protein
MPATVTPASVGAVHGAVMTGCIRIRARIRPWGSALPGTDRRRAADPRLQSAPRWLTDGGSELPLPGRRVIRASSGARALEITWADS